MAHYRSYRSCLSHEPSKTLRSQRSLDQMPTLMPPAVSLRGAGLASQPRFPGDDGSSVRSELAVVAAAEAEVLLPEEDPVASAAAAVASAVAPWERLGSSYSVEAPVAAVAGLDSLRTSSADYGWEGIEIHEHYGQSHIPWAPF
jgi:hypothetical protein